MSFWKYEPDIIKDTRAGLKVKEGKKPGLNFVLECLIFFVVFLVTNIAMSMAFLAIQICMLLPHGEVMEALTGGDIETFNELANEILNASPYLQPFQLLCTVIITVVVVLFCKLIQRRKISTIGFVKKNMVRDYVIGLGVGFVAFTLAVVICLVTGALKLSVSNEFNIFVFLVYIAGWFFQGMEEEVLCRGYFLPSVARRYSVWVGVLANSLVFAALHLGNDGIGVLPFINLILFGIFASLLFIKTNNIWLCSAVHSVWNFVQGNFYGILVSGGQSSVTVLNSTMNPDKSIINGGDFGLEGGLGVMISMLVGCGIMMYILYKDYKKTATDNE